MDDDDAAVLSGLIGCVVRIIIAIVIGIIVVHFAAKYW